MSKSSSSEHHRDRQAAHPATSKKRIDSSKRADEPDIERAAARVKAYLKEKCQGGAWSYGMGKEPAVEPSAWASVALRDDQEIARQAAAALVASQHKDGGWSTGADLGHSDWVTGPALFALRALSSAAEKPEKNLRAAIGKGQDYLLDNRTELYSLASRMIISAVKGTEALKYPRGWPWTIGCYHWVEPTSYSLFALKAPQLVEHPELIDAVQLANGFLVVSVCNTGGWNHGSHFCLGVHLPPYIVTTCEALIALQDLRDSEAVARGLNFLAGQSEAKEAGQADTAMALAWQTLALHCYDRQFEKPLARLIARQNEDGSFGPNVMVSALASLALDTASGKNPFKFSWTNSKTVPQIKEG